MTKIIGISGVSGAGKTTLARYLAKAFHATSLFWDDYDEISQGPSDYEKWFKESKNSNDWKYDALADTLRQLKEGQKVLCPATKKELHPTSFIIFDAPLGYTHFATGQYIDHLLFLNTPMDIALARRLLRDHDNIQSYMKEELRTYLDSARPIFLDHHEEQQKRSDLILDGTKSPHSHFVKVCKHLGMSITSTPPLHFNPDVEVAGCFCEWDNRILFLKRHSDKSQGDTWSLPAGKVEQGETPKMAAIREILEETNLDISENLSEVGSLYVSLPHLKYVFHMFRKQLSLVSAYKLNKKENALGEWKTLDEALKTEFPLILAGKEALLKYKKTQSKNPPLSGST